MFQNKAGEIGVAVKAEMGRDLPDRVVCVGQQAACAVQAAFGQNVGGAETAGGFAGAGQVGWADPEGFGVGGHREVGAIIARDKIGKGRREACVSAGCRARRLIEDRPPQPDRDQRRMGTRGSAVVGAFVGLFALHRLDQLRKRGLIQKIGGAQQMRVGGQINFCRGGNLQDGPDGLQAGNKGKQRAGGHEKRAVGGQRLAIGADQRVAAATCESDHQMVIAVVLQSQPPAAVTGKARERQDLGRVISGHGTSNVANVKQNGLISG